MAHKHNVNDSDAFFSINPITRQLKNESSSKTSLIQFDHNSERFTFEIPRYIEGHDMTECDIVEVHYTNIDTQTKEQYDGVYVVDDMRVSPESDDVVILSWLISGNATQYIGSLHFLIRFACSEDEQHVGYVWNTAKYSAISVSPGMYNGNKVVDAGQYDVILDLTRRVDGAVYKANMNIEQVEDAVEAAEAAAEKAETKVESLIERNGKKPVSLWVGTQAEYDAIPVKDESRLYIITDDEINQNATDFEDIQNKLAEHGLTIDSLVERATTSENNYIVLSEIMNGVQAVLNALTEKTNNHDTQISEIADVAGSNAEQVSDLQENLGTLAGVVAGASNQLNAVEKSLPIHACGGTAGAGGKYTYTHRVYICGKTGNDETGDGTSAKPFKTLDKWFSLCNQGRPDNRLYIKSAGTYNCSYYFFNHIALHITGGTPDKLIDGIVLNFTNDETITFYGGHYNFNNITLKHGGSSDKVKNCFNFETTSLIFENVEFQGALLKTYGSFITTNGTFKAGRFEFYGTNGRINTIWSNGNVSIPIQIERGCNLQIGYTDGGKNAGAIATLAGDKDSGSVFKIEHSTVYFRINAFGGGRRKFAIDSTTSLIFLDQTGYDTLKTAAIGDVYSSNGCVFVNNSSASSPKNLFTNGSYN